MFSQVYNKLAIIHLPKIKMASNLVSERSQKCAIAVQYMVVGKSVPVNGERFLKYQLVILGGMLGQSVVAKIQKESDLFRSTLFIKRHKLLQATACRTSGFQFRGFISLQNCWVIEAYNCLFSVCLSIVIIQRPAPYYENYAYQTENVTPRFTRDYNMYPHYTPTYYPSSVPHYVPRVSTQQSIPVPVLQTKSTKCTPSKLCFPFIFLKKF